MRPLPSLLAITTILLCGCDRERADATETAVPESKGRPARQKSPAPPKASVPSRTVLNRLATIPADAQPATLAEHIYEIPDDELDLVLAPVVRHREPQVKRALLTVLYEETRLRPPIARLPLLIEVARQPEIEPSLRETIMAELGTTLNAEHGTSWADWVLAVEEHLAATEGLIRVTGNEEDPSDPHQKNN